MLSFPLCAGSAECILAVCSLLPITGMKADVIQAYAQAWFSPTPQYHTEVPIWKPKLIY